MRNISLLDCTLRDGGYVNDWDFGDDCIRETSRFMAGAGVEIVELGFLRDVPYNSNIAVFNDMRQVADVIGEKREGTLYAVMCEAVSEGKGGPLPLEKIAPCTDDTADVIRVIVWKRLLKEGFEYCKGIVERGYRLCVQPNRVDQYSFSEFSDTAQMFSTLSPMGFYVVDSFGISNRSRIMEYLQIADESLAPGISLGYHGHNNLMQAFGTAEAFLEMKTERDVIIDGSIFGIGRGAGNLNIELIAKYLNENYGKNYALLSMIAIWDKFIRHIQDKAVWGYTPGYFLSAVYESNPMYADFYESEMNLNAIDIDSILRSLSDTDRVIFTREKARGYMEKHIGERGL